MWAAARHQLRWVDAGVAATATLDAEIWTHAARVIGVWDGRRYVAGLTLSGVASNVRALEAQSSSAQGFVDDLGWIRWLEDAEPRDDPGSMIALPDGVVPPLLIPLAAWSRQRRSVVGDAMDPHGTLTDWVDGCAAMWDRVVKVLGESPP